MVASAWLQDTSVIVASCRLTSTGCHTKGLRGPTSKVFALCSNVCVRLGPKEPRAMSSMWPALTMRCLWR